MRSCLPSQCSPAHLYHWKPQKCKADIGCVGAQHMLDHMLTIHVCACVFPTMKDAAISLHVTDHVTRISLLIATLSISFINQGSPRI